ncbi:NVEALA domain-containing protein [Phocaeicola faecalis]|uniref:NVEALA domain-containing protein n=1 Tax=Phocaeicola faecalis TaxID=2786956 RepID=UPI001F33F9B3|nr:NVEALA domain-containing protein [Phocaeicola faecalis]
MKKNILKATVVAAFALIAGFNVYNSQKSDVMSELALANVEALADGENGGDGTCSFQKVKKNEKDHSLKCSGSGHQCCKLD